MLIVWVLFQCDSTNRRFLRAACISIRRETSIVSLNLSMDGGPSKPVRFYTLNKLVSDLDSSEAYPTDVMAAPPRKVSLDYHRTPWQVPATSGASLRQHHDNAVVSSRVPETPSDRNTPPSHATPSTVSLFCPSSPYFTQLCATGRRRPLFPRRFTATTTFLSLISLNLATRPVSTLQLRTTVHYGRVFNASGPN